MVFLYLDNLFMGLIVRILFLFFFLILISPESIAQSTRETRAVWISTNYRLDWPPQTFDEEEQKRALIEIFDDIIK